MITDDILKEFKDRMHISHGIEDERLKETLSASLADIQEKCGEFSITENKRGKELVFERSRYAYNDSVEFFEDNFLSQLISLSFELEGSVSDEY